MNARENVIMYISLRLPVWFNAVAKITLKLEGIAKQWLMSMTCLSPDPTPTGPGWIAYITNIDPNQFILSHGVIVMFPMCPIHAFDVVFRRTDSSISYPHQSPTISYLYPTSLIIWLWDMGPNTSLTRQGGCLWQYVLVPYPPHSIHGPCNQCHGKTPSRFTAALSQLIQARWLRLFGHMAMMDTSLDIIRAFKVSIWGLPKDWRCPPGCPHHTWLLTLEADLQPFNLGLNSA